MLWRSANNLRSGRKHWYNMRNDRYVTVLFNWCKTVLHNHLNVRRICSRWILHSLIKYITTMQTLTQRIVIIDYWTTDIVESLIHPPHTLELSPKDFYAFQKINYMGNVIQVQKVQLKRLEGRNDCVFILLNFITLYLLMIFFLRWSPK